MKVIILLASIGLAVAGWNLFNSRPLLVEVAVIEENIPIQVFGLGTVEARVLANKPRIVLADEPTAALDSDRAGIVMDMLRKVAIDQQAAVIIVTHDEKIYDRFDKIFHLCDGVLDNTHDLEMASST